MKHTISVTYPDATRQSFPKGTTVGEALAAWQHTRDELDDLGALVNHDTASISFGLDVDSTIAPLTLRHPHGLRIYRRSVAFLAAKVVRELYPEAVFSVEHSLGTGLYCTFENNGDLGITEEQVRAIETEMRIQAAADHPIVRGKLAFMEAVEQFKREQQLDKYNLLRYRNPPVITLYNCGEFSDLAHGVMAPSTGALKYFDLVRYAPGFVIQIPERETAPHVAKFEEQPHLFNIFQEHKRWGRILGLSTVGQLNELIAEGQVGDFVKISEALHEKKIANIADQVYQHRDRVRMLLIAGPSSAGKTTFSKRLMVQLRVNGLKPVTISVDDYFVDRERTPTDEDGHYDFEHVEAIDLDLFNDHLERLDRGEEIQLPRFNFQEGKREYRGDTMQLADDQILILEGIHGLNPRLTQSVPTEHTFRIYISALGQLNLDRHNRISTTDNRLLRRMVRDHKFRGHSALTTLRMWPSVRRGEKQWIFPNQQNADIAFNSALEYELAVLKPVAEPLLCEVKPSEPEYTDARRLLDFLGYFLVAPEELVPATSILREYIGKSGFKY